MKSPLRQRAEELSYELENVMEMLKKEGQSNGERRYKKIMAEAVFLVLLRLDFVSTAVLVVLGMVVGHMIFNRKKRNGNGELAVVLAVTVIIFGWAAYVARVQRGYTAFGGEYLVLAFPVVYYLAKKTVRDWIEEIRELFEEAEETE